MEAERWKEAPGSCGVCRGQLHSCGGQSSATQVSLTADDQDRVRQTQDFKMGA